MSYFPNYSCSKNEIEVDLPNYATKSDLINGTGVDTSQFAKFNKHYPIFKTPQSLVYLHPKLFDPLNVDVQFKKNPLLLLSNHQSNKKT